MRTARMALAALMGLTVCAAVPLDRRGDAARAQADLDRQLAGMVRGNTSSCLPITAAPLSTTAYGPTILYRQSRGLAYRTDTAGGCEGVGRGDILVTRSPLGRPCQGDIATTIDNASRFQTGSCSLGSFTEYRKPK